MDRERLGVSIGIEELPSKVSEGLVRIRHAVGVLTLGNRGPFLAVCCHQFIRQLGRSSSAFLFSDGAEDPAEGQRLLTVLVHLHWDLVGSTTDPLGSDFDVRLHVLDRLFENLDRRTVLDLFCDFVEGIVEDVVGNGLLAIVHQAIDELSNQQRVVSWIRTEGCT